MPGPSVPHIAAAAALAASVTLGGSTAPGAKAASGYALNRGSEDTFDVDRIQDEAQQLQVLPITVIKTDYKLQFLRQISSTATYICYGLKLGHIRALNKANANRALLKGHSTMIVDLQFQSPTSGLLASCDQAGNLFVRRLYDHEAEKVEEEVLVQHSLSGSKSGTYHLSWHPSSEALLAVTEGDRVSLVSVPLTAAVAAASPSGAYLARPPHSHTPGGLTCLAFSPRGDLLAAGDDCGNVLLWCCSSSDMDSLPANPLPAPTFRLAPDLGPSNWPSSLGFLPDLGHGHTVLLVADSTGSLLQLWSISKAQGATTGPPLPTPTSPAAGTAGAGGAAATPALQASSAEGGAAEHMGHEGQGGEGAQGGSLGEVGLRVRRTYQLRFTCSSKGPDAFFNHVLVQPGYDVVLACNTLQNKVHVLHAHQDAASGTAVFDFVSTFAVTLPILSCTTCTAPHSQQDNAEDAVFQLYCMQTQAIQQYTLYPAHCLPPVELEEEWQRQAALEGEAGASAGPALQPMLAPTLHTVTSPLLEPALPSSGSGDVLDIGMALPSSGSGDGLDSAKAGQAAPAAAANGVDAVLDGPVLPVPPFQSLAAPMAPPPTTMGAALKLAAAAAAHQVPTASLTPSSSATGVQLLPEDPPLTPPSASPQRRAAEGSAAAAAAGVAAAGAAAAGVAASAAAGAAGVAAAAAAGVDAAGGEPEQVESSGDVTAASLPAAAAAAAGDQEYTPASATDLGEAPPASSPQSTRLPPPPLPFPTPGAQASFPSNTSVTPPPPQQGSGSQPHPASSSSSSSSPPLAAVRPTPFPFHPPPPSSTPSPWPYPTALHAGPSSESPMAVPPAAAPASTLPAAPQHRANTVPVFCNLTPTALGPLPPPPPPGPQPPSPPSQPDQLPIPTASTASTTSTASAASTTPPTSSHPRLPQGSNGGVGGVTSGSKRPRVEGAGPPTPPTPSAALLSKLSKSPSPQPVKVPQPAAILPSAGTGSPSTSSSSASCATAQSQPATAAGVAGFEPRSEAEAGLPPAAAAAAAAAAGAETELAASVPAQPAVGGGPGRGGQGGKGGQAVPGAGGSAQAGPGAKQGAAAAAAVDLKELVRGMKVELKADLKAEMKAGHKAAEEKLLKAMEASLKSAATRQREEVASLLASAVTSLTQKLDAWLLDAPAATQVQLSSSLGPAIKAAVAEALPGAAQQAVDSAVTRAVKAAVPRVVGEVLRDCVANSVLPSFERATQVMFGQVEQAFTSGIAASLAALSSSGQAATSDLQTSSQQLHGLVSSMQAEVTSLAQSSSQVAALLASTTSQAAEAAAAASASAASAAASAAAAAASAPPPPAIAHYGPIEDGGQLQWHGSSTARHSPLQGVLGVLSDQLRCGQYNDAFTTALNTDTATLLWLLGHTSCDALLGHPPCPLTREVMLSLVSHLTYDLATDTPLKLQWLHQLGCCLHASLAVPPGLQASPRARTVLEASHHSLLAFAKTAAPSATAAAAVTCSNLISGLL